MIASEKAVIASLPIKFIPALADVGKSCCTSGIAGKSAGAKLQTSRGSGIADSCASGKCTRGSAKVEREEITLMAQATLATVGHSDELYCINRRMSVDGLLPRCADKSGACLFETNSLDGRASDQSFYEVTKGKTKMAMTTFNQNQNASPRADDDTTGEVDHPFTNEEIMAANEGHLLPCEHCIPGKAVENPGDGLRQK